MLHLPPSLVDFASSFGGRPLGRVSPVEGCPAEAMCAKADGARLRLLFARWSLFKCSTFRLRSLTSHRASADGRSGAYLQSKAVPPKRCARRRTALACGCTSLGEAALSAPPSAFAR